MPTSPDASAIDAGQIDTARPPAAQGFSMPAEWAPHAATWLSWPHKEASWPGRLDRIPPIFDDMVRALVPGEAVHIVARDEALANEIRARLRRALGAALWAAGRVVVHVIPNDDAWIRDHGPIFIQRVAPAPAQAIVDWDYNAWGCKYPPFAADDAVPTHIGRRLGLPVFAPGMVLEGGSIDVNGAGALLTTEACLLNPNRNPGLRREEIEARLRAFLGVSQILWLDRGIDGDDTDGHIDDLARFVAADVVVASVDPDPRSPDHEPLRENLARLRSFRLADGRPLRLVELPVPDPVECQGQRLPASYANFYIANAVVLLPAFGCAQDEAARAILQRLLPGRQVVPMDCRDLVWGLGAFHCLTQQQPAL